MKSEEYKQQQQPQVELPGCKAHGSGLCPVEWCRRNRGQWCKNIRGEWCRWRKI